MSFESPGDAKKSRSKPVRNADGILIRKDGRPDMRSQSSAANLRKVHARKDEQQREGESGLTPASLRHSMSTAPETPSPTGHGHLGQDITSSVQKRHNDILGRMFPEGLDTSRKQHDYAHQVFNEDRDHTAHTRAQSSQKAAKNSLHIKKEQVTRSRNAEIQNLTNGDVNMQDAETHVNGHKADSDQASARGQVRHSEPEYYNAQNQVTSGQEAESRVQIPETQATESSASLIAESAEVS
jgi:hypothetical protein